MTMKAVVNNRPFWLHAVIMWLAFFAPTAKGDDRFDGIDAYIEEAMQRWQVPGLAIAVVKDGDVVLSRAYGRRHMTRDDASVTVDTSGDRRRKGTRIGVQKGPNPWVGSPRQ